MTQIIRLNNSMTGNFSGKSVVTPSGTKPIFTYTANRNRNVNFSSFLESDYKEAGAIPKLTRRGVGQVVPIETFNGNGLSLINSGYSDYVSTGISGSKFIMAIRLTTEECQSGGSESRILSSQFGNTFYHIRQKSHDCNDIILSKSGSTDVVELFNGSFKDKNICVAVMVDGSSCRFTTDGKNIMTGNFQFLGGDLNYLSILASPNDAVIRSTILNNASIYVGDDLDDISLINVWNDTDS